ncbi:nucleotide sugar dehydrogenase [Intestinibacter bartlettii]|uniref:nucleotide sugar dehydrogenase n=1 Tax=Intestinibacter bartlettii TaxID=261299 RepID=UPI0022E92294|nr:nucleotide sugar dehydrogenase [Intestinibacter bartlettii]
MNIGVIGCGYVGLTVATVFTNNIEVSLWDINLEKLRNIEQGIPPFEDYKLKTVLGKNYKKLKCYTEKDKFIINNDVFILALPTDYCEAKQRLDTEKLENVIEEILTKRRQDGIRIIIKSTIPIGFTERMRYKYKYNQIYVIPEFLREGNAYNDIVNSNRIIIGGEKEKIQDIVDIMYKCMWNKNIEDINIVYVTPTEAEAIKLFTNSYLAMRVAFFNELDMLSESMDLNSASLIKAICLDSRIGDYYNNPSFGYGGYCLPKDTKQLAMTLPNNNLFQWVNYSNERRKRFIVERIMDFGFQNIGVYRLQMKNNSDNTRNSSIIEIIKELVKNNVKIYLYEPIIKNNIKFSDNIKIVNSVSELDSLCDLIITNRITEELNPYIRKVYTRDIYNRD